MTLNCLLYARSVEDTRDAAASAQRSPPKASFVPSDEPLQKSKETEPRALGSVSIGSLVEKLNLAVAQQAKLVAQLKASYSGESSRLVQKDEEIALLKAQLVGTQAELEFANSYTRALTEEKMSLLDRVNQERADAKDYKANCLWALKYMEKNKDALFSRLDEFRNAIQGSLERQESKLRELSIEYDEELYPHLVSSIAERR